MRNTSNANDIAFSVVFFACLFTLIPTQVYGSWILWKVADRISRKTINDLDPSRQLHIADSSTVEELHIVLHRRHMASSEQIDESGSKDRSCAVTDLDFLDKVER